MGARDDDAPAARARALSRYRLPPLPRSWRAALLPELRQPYFRQLTAFLDAEARAHEIRPPAAHVFRALELTPCTRVRAVLLGQDPYPGPGQAHGLCFSVPHGVPPPPSLRNIFRELHTDLGILPPLHGSLEAWARRGVLLLNSVLTVRAGAAASHRGRGWERFTDAVIHRVGRRRVPVVFLLWGAHAQTRIPLIDARRHPLVTAAHPSPLAAWHGFFGSRTFSRANEALVALGMPVIDWSL